ncbi:hypothetical protein [Paraburkholderia sp. J8-2]|uniref:hypothetical protein n=1 Tax=Paraburkholderia sp. J8-2 TaxID=2805440 RepID=UPI002AB705F5|nr:hypothetical protein [Paraburkholderia sp. J8-2]
MTDPVYPASINQPGGWTWLWTIQVLVVNDPSTGPHYYYIMWQGPTPGTGLEGTMNPPANWQSMTAAQLENALYGLEWPGISGGAVLNHPAGGNIAVVDPSEADCNWE